MFFSFCFLFFLRQMRGLEAFQSYRTTDQHQRVWLSRAQRPYGPKKVEPLADKTATEKGKCWQPIVILNRAIAQAPLARRFVQRTSHTISSNVTVASRRTKLYRTRHSNRIKIVPKSYQNRHRSTGPRSSFNGMNVYSL